MQIQGIPLGKDSHRIQDVSGPVNGGDPALHSQWYTQTKNGDTVGIEGTSQKKSNSQRTIPS